MSLLLEYLNVFLNNMSSESQFGIIIEDEEEFVNVVQNVGFEFVPGPDYHADDNINLWESSLNGHHIMGVCCTEQWVIQPNYTRYNRQNNIYTYKKQNFKDLEELCLLLNENGFECKIGVLQKTCGCS